MNRPEAANTPDDKPEVPRFRRRLWHGAAQRDWDGPTYYSRPQLKAAPFNNWVVGGYIFLAGLSGASALLAAIATCCGGPRRRGGRRGGAAILPCSRRLLGSALLIYDLHTPKRFYNMLRVAKGTSPMSIGTWILLAFSGLAGFNAGRRVARRDSRPALDAPGFARVAQVPAAAAGAGLATYTASLLSATSTPLWAAAPQALAVRFGSSSIAAGAAALSLGESRPTKPRGR